MKLVPGWVQLGPYTYTYMRLHDEPGMKMRTSLYDSPCKHLYVKTWCISRLEKSFCHFEAHIRNLREVFQLYAWLCTWNVLMWSAWEGKCCCWLFSFQHGWKVCSLRSPCTYMWRVHLYPNTSRCAYMRMCTVYAKEKESTFEKSGWTHKCAVVTVIDMFSVVSDRPQQLHAAPKLEKAAKVHGTWQAWLREATVIKRQGSDVLTVYSIYSDEPEKIV